MLQENSKPAMFLPGFCDEYCLVCDKQSKTCYGASKNQCNSCNEGYALNKNTCQQIYLVYEQSTFTESRITQINNLSQSASSILVVSTTVMSLLQNIGPNSSFGILISGLTFQNLVYLYLFKVNLPKPIYSALQILSGKLPSQQLSFLNPFSELIDESVIQYQNSKYLEVNLPFNIIINCGQAVVLFFICSFLSGLFYILIEKVNQEKVRQVSVKPTRVSQKIAALEIKEKRVDLSNDQNGKSYSGKIEIKNKHSSEVAFKVKCNYTAFYSVKPSAAILKPNEKILLSIQMHINALKSNFGQHKIQILAYILEDQDKQKPSDVNSIDNYFKGDNINKLQKKVLDIHIAQIDKLDMSQIQEVAEVNDQLESARASLQYQNAAKIQQDIAQDTIEKRQIEFQTQPIQLPTKREYYGRQASDMEYKYSILKQKLEEQEAIQVKIEKEIQFYEQKQKEVQDQTTNTKRNLNSLMMIVYFLVGVLICLFLKSQNFLFFNNK
ncbi:hypothetical protein ABPG72_003470 [Tetrahymena utriculariae]